MGYTPAGAQVVQRLGFAVNGLAFELDAEARLLELQAELREHR